MRTHLIVSVAAVCALTAPAAAEEVALRVARGKLNTAEKGLASLEPGDGRRANDLIGKVNSAKKLLLNNCRNKTAPEWQVEAKRADRLDVEIRARFKAKAEAKPAPVEPTPGEPKPAEPAPPPAAAPVSGVTSARCGPSQLAKSVDRTQLVFGAKAQASSAYGTGYTPDQVLGPPNVFPTFGDRKGAWCPKSKDGKERLVVTFPPTQATGVIIYETCEPDAISAVLVDTAPVYAANGPAKFQREAKALLIQFEEARSVTTVELRVDSSRVRKWPEIDCVALIGAEKSRAAAPKPAPTVEAPKKPAVTRRGRRGTPDAPVGAARALASGMRMGASEFVLRIKPERLVYAHKAQASTHFQKNGWYGPEYATDAPDVFPRYADSGRAWCPNNKDKQDWLEVAFPPTKTRWIYVYETACPGVIRSIVDDSGATLYTSTETNLGIQSVREAQVLYVELPAAKTISRLKITIDSSLIPPTVRQYANIDTVALGTKGPRTASMPTPAPMHKDDMYYYARAWAAVVGLRQTLKGWNKTSLKADGAPRHTTSNPRYEARNIKNKDHPLVAYFTEAVEALDARIAELAEISKKNYASLGPDPAAQGKAHVEWFKAHTHIHKGDTLLPKSPSAATAVAYATFGQVLRASVAQLRVRVAFLHKASIWDHTIESGSTRRLAKKGEAAIAKATAHVDYRIKEALKAQSIDPRDVEEKERRVAVLDRSRSETWVKLSKASESLKRVIVFQKAYAGKPDPATVSAQADIQRRREALDRFIVDQLANERLPELKPGHAKYIKIAKGLVSHLEGAGHIGLSEDPDTKEGVWTSRDLVSSEDHGTYTKKTYRVRGESYKFERFWFAVTLPYEGRADLVKVDWYAAKYYHKGGKPSRKWHIYNSMSGYIMPKKNLPK